MTKAAKKPRKQTRAHEIWTQLKKNKLAVVSMFVLLAIVLLCDLHFLRCIRDKLAQGVVSQAAYGFDHWYRNGYDIWGSKGVISTSRAFTARPDFSAEVRVETAAGAKVATFRDDHFAKLLDHVAECIATGNHDGELEECMLQARLLQQAKELS